MVKIDNHVIVIGIQLHMKSAACVGLIFMGNIFGHLLCLYSMHIMSSVILPGSPVRVFMPKRVSKYLVFSCSVENNRLLVIIH